MVCTRGFHLEAIMRFILGAKRSDRVDYAADEDHWHWV